MPLRRVKFGQGGVNGTANLIKDGRKQLSLLSECRLAEAVPRGDGSFIDGLRSVADDHFGIECDC